jgi:hypothetical protein
MEEYISTTMPIEVVQKVKKEVSILSLEDMIKEEKKIKKKLDNDKKNKATRKKKNVKFTNSNNKNRIGNQSRTIIPKREHKIKLSYDYDNLNSIDECLLIKSNNMLLLTFKCNGHVIISNDFDRSLLLLRAINSCLLPVDLKINSQKNINDEKVQHVW